MSNANGTKWIRPEKRVRIYARDGWRCQWCSRHASQLKDPLTLDHFLSRDAGGGNEAGNLLTACFECNSKRRHEPALSFAKASPVVLDRVLDALERPLPAFIP
jgi:5-methylcytosine-specific restriction endonuclease McrA